MNDTYTEDFGNICSCSRERSMVIDLLTAWEENGLPDDFNNDNVRVAFNRSSGNVFLVNDDCQVAMLNYAKTPNTLEMFYSSPYDGIEGNLDDLISQIGQDWHSDDVEWLFDIVENEGTIEQQKDLLSRIDLEFMQTYGELEDEQGEIYYLFTLGDDEFSVIDNVVSFGRDEYDNHVEEAE